MADDDDEEYEEYVTFLDCDCPHDSEEHGWQACLATGCACEGHWEE